MGKEKLGTLYKWFLKYNLKASYVKSQNKWFYISTFNMSDKEEVFNKMWLKILDNYGLK